MPRIKVERKPTEPTIQVATRIEPELAKRLRVFAAEHDLLVQDIVAAGIKAVIETGKRAVVG